MNIACGILASILVGLFVALFTISYTEKTQDKVFKVYMVLVFIFLLYCGFWDYKSFTDEWHCKQTSTEHIVALGDSDGINGHFYMRRGYIESKLYYNYMVNVGGGGYVANKVPARETTVYEVNDNYRIEWYIKSKGYGVAKEEETFWKAYIPSGSITESYNIDLE